MIPPREYRGARAVLAGGLVSALAGCAAPDLEDPRAQALMALPGPQYFAEQAVARDLAARCPTFVFQDRTADAMNDARLASGITPGSTGRGAVELETDVKKRSLAGFYARSQYAALDPCDTLAQERARNTPLSVLVAAEGA